MNLMILAKFKIDQITEDYTGSNEAGEPVTQKSIKMSAVIGQDDPNKEWSKWTPSGRIEMVVTNPTAVEQFKVGKIYSITMQMD